MHAEISYIIDSNGWIQLLKSQESLIFSEGHAGFVGGMHLLAVTGMAVDILLTIHAGLYMFQYFTALSIIIPCDCQ